MEGDPDGSRTVFLVAGAMITQLPAPVPYRAARLCRTEASLAMIPFEKFGQHQPLNPTERALRARGRRASSPSTLWPTKRACRAALRPLHARSKPMF